MGIFNEVRCEILLDGQTLTNGQSKDYDRPVDGSLYKITSYGRLHVKDPQDGWIDTDHDGTFEFSGDQGRFIAHFEKGQLTMLE